MRSVSVESNGPGASDAHKDSKSASNTETALKVFQQHSSTLPFGQRLSLSSIGGPTYITAQTLIQQVLYTLSDKVFSYSPETFDLDFAVKDWASQNAQNAYGYVTGVQPMETRMGAGSIALGYIFSKDFDLKKRHIPQTVLTSTSTLQFLRPALDQLSLLYSVANPFVAHVAAVDYAGGSSSGLVTDYSTAITVADELGLGLVSSLSAYESQHMALFSTLLAAILPTVHIYDGLTIARETVRVVDVLDQHGLFDVYKSISQEIAGPSSKHTDAEGRALQLLKAFNGELGTDYGLFEYKGHAEAEAILVVFGSVESSLASQVAECLSKDGTKIGVVTVRVYRPFVEEEFIRVLPASVKKVGILGQVHDKAAVSDSSIRSRLYDDVLAAINFSTRDIDTTSIRDIKYPREERWTPVSIAAAFQLLFGKPVLRQEENGTSPNGLQLLDPASVQQYTFWDIDDSPSAIAAISLGQAFAIDSANNVTVKTGYDNMLQGGAIRIDIRRSKRTVEASYSIDRADVAYIGDSKLLKDLDLVQSVRDNGKLILRLPSIKDEDIEKTLPLGFRKALAGKKIDLFVVNPQADEEITNDPSLEQYLVHAAFLRVAIPSQESTGFQKLASIVGSQARFETVRQGLDKTLRQIEIPEVWATLEPEKETHDPVLPGDINFNSFSAFGKVEDEEPSALKDWKAVAKALMFKEAYGTTPALRPDLSVKTFTVHVKENRRLTPPTYDRNIFHIEFDLGTTGLKYDIGEALGIHAENDSSEVTEFIKFYGLDPSAIVQVPSREDPKVLETRTIYQALVQNIDIFGKPPKRFYESLASFTTSDSEKTALLALAGPEGAVEFKRRAEVDTITFADILLEFPSAHPSFPDLARIVSPMKRREYSIASCQKVSPTAVALMIVAVSWVDPKGRDRFGQATRYLKDLAPGSPVVVSVKPSVMKLPPKSTQPLIMAGLGTGLAPFRAFVQHRALEKSQGKEIGAVLLYMGSRHQREEYCYGEEWEAYQDAGVITLLGRAFSRDQPQKIYIQDRMRQTLEDIRKAYMEEQGAFYLCGPTWPVPDVTEVLEEAIRAEGARVGKRVDSKKEIEKLKDEGRYVLEVY
ncbi:MAG: hypothetical protein M1834_002538 [Cirrosporium novae-zelandiae]|nr:MAG: hypothetical protein M1834_002538 [Cirrosporium novae-zelandiae]